MASPLQQGRQGVNIHRTTASFVEAGIPRLRWGRCSGSLLRGSRQTFLRLHWPLAPSKPSGCVKWDRLLLLIFDYMYHNYLYSYIYIYIPIYIYWLFDWDERLMVSFCSWWMAVGDKVDSGVRIWKFHDTARLRLLCPQWLSGKWPRVTMHLTWALSRVGRKTNYADLFV